MKTILVLLLIAGISVCSLAQNEKPINEFQKKEFNDKQRTDSIEYFKISPLFISIR